MKRKIVLAVALLLLLLTGVAMATGGTAGDPLISVDYLLNFFSPKLTTAVEERVEENMKEVDKRLGTLLDEKNDHLLAGLGNVGEGWTSTTATAVTKIGRGDTLTLFTGTDFTFHQGDAAVTVTDGTLVDITTGTTATGTVTLSPNHRYLVGEGTRAELTTACDTSYLSAQGYYSLTDGGLDTLPFVDMYGDAWYYDYVSYVCQQGLFQGMTDTTFVPSAPMTRAMLATVLHRLAGTPTPADGQVDFVDVDEGDWYAKPVLWAAEENIVNGMGEGTFLPNGNVTREQMATMLYRYATSYCKVTAEATGDVSIFSDSETISSWAEEPIAWAVGAGVVGGRTDGTLDPNGTATRGEVATMLQRFSNFLA